MSAFCPGSYEEAKATHKPLARNKPLRAVQISRTVKSPQATANATQRPIPRKRRTIKRKVKRVSNARLKKRLWKLFSIHVRASAADEQGYVQCVTCPARHLWNSGEIHAGHWIHNRLDFEPRNIHPQCARCNYHWNTQVSISYSVFMARTYGVEVMEELRLLSHTKGNRYTRVELLAMIERYRSLNAENPLCQE